ncbi:MAG: 30S ribosomal protein S2 [Anaerolineae bacterium]|nr:30S ribosomal protein S2 [Anaerolineae bacterium]
MAIISMKALLESGVHFGHRTNKWDPRMKPYIFTERNGIHIIDLQLTVKLLNDAYNLIRDSVEKGGNILFVGTKRQAKETILEEALRCGMPYVTERWLGGTLTNWSTIHQRVQELERLEGLRDSGEIERLTKKEGLLIERDISRLERHLSGIRDLKRPPDMLFIVDVCDEDAAVHEANLLNIPIVAMVDTNCNPMDIDFVIPSNDDAIRAIKLLVAKIADAVIEGKSMRKEEELDEKSAQPVPEMSASTKATRKIDTDDQNVQEEDLLGEATLAKLNISRQPAEELESSAEKPEEKKAEKEELAPKEEVPEKEADEPKVKPKKTTETKKEDPKPDKEKPDKDGKETKAKAEKIEKAKTSSKKEVGEEKDTPEKDAKKTKAKAKKPTKTKKSASKKEDAAAEKDADKPKAKLKKSSAKKED